MKGWEVGLVDNVEIQMHGRHKRLDIDSDDVKGILKIQIKHKKI